MLATTKEYQRTDFVLNRPLPEGLDKLAHQLLGRYRLTTSNSAPLRQAADTILEKAETLREYSDSLLRKHLEECQQQVRRKRNRREDEHAYLPYLVEAADRVLKLRAYPEQVMGALAIGQGCIVEMATGEGKTLTVALAGVLAGWAQLPCHIITANDYLAQRDAEQMKGLYALCGLTVSSVLQKMNGRERQQAYEADVVYTTSKELLGDFLRDRMALGRMHMASMRNTRELLYSARIRNVPSVQRGLHTAIVDEADNLLIDEAATPLIISRSQKNESLVQAVESARDIAAELREGEHYRIDEKGRQINLLEAAYPIIDECSAKLDDHYRSTSWLRELVVQAIIAETWFHRDKQYVVQDNKIVIVDDFTGRLMPGRSWKQGLHQAVEAKEHLPITDPTEAIASLSFQKFFNFFRRLSGVTGTAREAASEFWNIYQLPFVRIPTHRPCQRTEQPVRICQSAHDKWMAVAAEIVEVHRSGRPILVGSRSVRDSEKIAELLTGRGLDARLLNATREREEAQVIKLAGQKRMITIATNMAGRGTDIKLGKDVAELGGLHVVSTEINESARIDRQLYGRAGRQGDPGSAVVIACLDDEIFQATPLFLRWFTRTYFRLKLPLRIPLARWAFSWAQHNTSTRSYRRRKSIMRQDKWMEDTFALSGMEFGE